MRNIAPKSLLHEANWVKEGAKAKDGKEPDVEKQFSFRFRRGVFLGLPDYGPKARVPEHNSRYPKWYGPMPDELKSNLCANSDGSEGSNHESQTECGGGDDNLFELSILKRSGLGVIHARQYITIHVNESI